MLPTTFDVKILTLNNKAVLPKKQKYNFGISKFSVQKTIWLQDTMNY